MEFILQILYLGILIFTIGKIILDTPSTPKTLAYILLVIAFPAVGILFYYSFGLNFRHRERKRRGREEIDRLESRYRAAVPDETEATIREHAEAFRQYDELARFVYRTGGEYIGHSRLQLLTNGEEKFPEVLRTLGRARHYIHLEYYAWENDIRGNQIKDALLEKLNEGVAVRIMYDDYASRKIKRNIVRELRAGGAEIYPVIKVKFSWLANRLNHRDHRKLIIVDGHTAFIGGINLSDRYDNSIDTGLYWRDTHLKVAGNTALHLSRHWLSNWNAVHPNRLAMEDLLPRSDPPEMPGAHQGLVQVVAGGPVYALSTIMLTYVRLFTLTRQKLYIANPYFIPNQSILDGLKQAALSGVDVRLMLPKVSDSAVVGAASKFYYPQLLEAGVRIFEYEKGFLHAKTVVADGRVSVIGTANLDIRSFDLNFEIFALVYDEAFAGDFEAVFLDDLTVCDEMTLAEWQDISGPQRFVYATARLTSAFL